MGKTPSTVYSLNSVTFAKDMIFGWCILTSDSGWYPVSDLPLKVLQVIKKAYIPILSPQEYLDEINNAIQKRNKEVIENRKLLQERRAKLQQQIQYGTPFKNGNTWNRGKDLEQLKSQVAERTLVDENGDSTCDLGYCHIHVANCSSCNTPIQYAVYTPSSTLGAGKAYTFKTIDEVYSFILRKWW